MLSTTIAQQKNFWKTYIWIIFNCEAMKKDLSKFKEEPTMIMAKGRF